METKRGKNNNEACEEQTVKGVVGDKGILPNAQYKWQVGSHTVLILLSARCVRKVVQTLQRWRVKKRISSLWKKNKLTEHLGIYSYTSTHLWQVQRNVLETLLCVCTDILCLFSHRKQRDQINLFMFISASLYPLASISPSSQHQLMCVALKSNLYHLNESKAPRQNSGSPISTHQLLPLKSPIVWVGLWWLVGILMWCRLLVFLFPLAASQTLAKTLEEKVITHRQLCYYLPKQWGEVAIFKGLHSEPCLHASTSMQAMCYITHTPASAAVTCSHVSHFLMLMRLSSTLFRSFTFMSNKGKYLELANSTWLV